MSDATETVKQTAAKAQAQVKAQAEAIQKASTTAFKDGVDRSLNSLTELNAQGKKNLEAVVESGLLHSSGGR